MLFLDEGETFDFSVKKGRELTPSKFLVEPDSKRVCAKKTQKLRYQVVFVKKDKSDSSLF